MLDRLPNLGCDRHEQLDLGFGELSGLPRSHVERAFELVPSEDRHGEDRLILVLGKVREELEARVEMGLRGDHDRFPARCCHARDPFARPHPRRARHLLDTTPVRRPQHELVRSLVIEVNEARVGTERVCDLARNQLQHLLEIERGVDSGDRVGQEP